MKMKWICGALTASLMMAGQAMAQLTDDASNYGAPNPDWNTGSNEGDGFGPWTITDGGGGHFLASSTEGDGSRTNSIDTAGQAFGLWNANASSVTDAIRGFDTNVWGDGAVLSFDFSFRWDGGARGVTLINDVVTEIFYVSIGSGGYDFPGGSAPATSWPGEREFGEVITFTFTQNGPNIDWQFSGIHASSPNESGTITGQVIDTFRIFNAEGSGGDPNNVYFNNLSVTPGTALPLEFTDGAAAPTLLGDALYTLARSVGGGVDDDIVLSSSNTNALTVPSTVSFEALANSLTFTATVVSVTNGSAILVASNVTSGAWAQFLVTPVVPVLSIGGPFELFELGTNSYTLTRVGAVTDDIEFSSSDTNVLVVPASQSFVTNETELTFDVEMVGFGTATIFASNLASGAVAEYNVGVFEPGLTLSGPTSVRIGSTPTFTLTRVGPIANTVSLSSNSNPSVMSVPGTVAFTTGENTLTFQGTALTTGSTTLVAWNFDASSAPFTVEVTALPEGTYDEGTLYSGAWNDGDNNGLGFGPWVFNHSTDTNEPAYFAGVFIGDPALAGISGMDQASFGFYANPAGSAANAEVSRTLSNALTVGQTFRFQLGLNFDSGTDGSNRGFSLLAGATELVNINMGNSSVITLNGNAMFTNYGAQAMTLDLQYVGDGSIRVTGTGRDGVETIDQVLTVPAGAPDNFKLYFNACEAIDQRQMYINALQVTDGPAIPLAFTAGEAAPLATGEYLFTLQRDGTVADDIELSSSDANVLTVPALVSFTTGVDTISFTGTVVSLTNGSAVIVASNVASGAWAQYVVTPIAPTLSIGGPFELFDLGTNEYSLTRTGAVGDDIVFSSSDTNVLTVPVGASFVTNENALVFDVEMVGFGFATIIASNTASGVFAEYNVTVQTPSLTLSGPDSLRDGQTRTYTLTRVGPIDDTVYLTSSVPSTFSVPATAVFSNSENTVSFEGSALGLGSVVLTASNGDAAATPLNISITAIPSGTYDEGSFYSGSWNDGDNEGSGFGPWVFNHSSDTNEPAYFAGVFIGDPANSGISGMDQQSFGFYANPANSGANAEVTRTLNSPMMIGDTFVFQLGLNFDSGTDGSNRGFNLFAGGNELLNINQGNGAAITVNGSNMFTNYGTQAMTISIEYQADGIVRVYGTGRDGVETFDSQIIINTGAPDNFKFYFNGTEANDSRQMYINNLQVIEGVGGPEISEITIAGTDVSANVGVGEVGKSYSLDYTLDLTADPVIWTEVDQADGDGVNEIILMDTTANPFRVYRLVIRDSIP